jgi:hypothetical protein
VEAAVSRLRAAFAAEVPASIVTLADHDAARTGRARDALTAAGTVIEAPQLLLLVDRNPAVQEASILLVRPAADWALVGGTINAQLTGANVCFAKVRLEQQPVRFQPDLADEREAKRFRFMPADEGGANIQTSNPLQSLSARSHYRAALDQMLTVEGI